MESISKSTKERLETDSFGEELKLKNKNLKEEIEKLNQECNSLVTILFVVFCQIV